MGLIVKVEADAQAHDLLLTVICKFFNLHHLKQHTYGLLLKFSKQMRVPIFLRETAKTFRVSKSKHSVSFHINKAAF